MLLYLLAKYPGPINLRFKKGYGKIQLLCRSNTNSSQISTLIQWIKIPNIRNFHEQKTMCLSNKIIHKLHVREQIQVNFHFLEMLIFKVPRVTNGGLLTCFW